MDKVHIIVTGANGQVGKELRDLAGTVRDAEFTFLSREDLPLENFELLRTVLNFRKPDVVINCAAYTAVDNAESFRDLAFLINGESVGVLAAVCSELGSRFIHISTDYVFDGTSHVPYRETDPTSPVNTYGASKLEGEEQALKFNPDSIIVRTSWVYSAYGKNFVKTMMKLMSERKEINVVDDQLGSPTYAADLAETLLHIATAAHAPGGIYHYSNGGAISWYQFAQAIAHISGSDCIVHPVPSSSYPTPAKRPAFSVMNTDRIREVFAVEIKPWRQSLEKCIKKISTSA
ncbi:MAG TPA: dTDP-4-dehydrorhamnose reductase [Chitinophagaceae bacterium]|nr:dTDP-4-dehydrorhamnose reductase [Chitinophagaceae bacterium]